MRRTSLDSYEKIKSEGLLSARRFEVYEILFNDGPLTAHEVVGIARRKYPLANQTGFNARLSELQSLGVVDVVGEKKNPVSGHLNCLWDVTEKLPIKIEKPIRCVCKTCGGKGYIEEAQLRMDFKDLEKQKGLKNVERRIY